LINKFSRTAAFHLMRRRIRSSSVESCSDTSLATVDASPKLCLLVASLRASFGLTQHAVKCIVLEWKDAIF
jgi:hypothetical protein